MTLLSICLLGVHPPYLADDYWHLCVALQRPGLGWFWTDHYAFSRMPVLIIFLAAGLKTHVIENYPRVLLVFFFGIHALALSLFVKTLIEASGRTLSKYASPFVGVTALFAFQPNNYEIHLWHLLSVHSMAAFLIAIVFRLKNRVTMIVLLTLGLMTYDTFILLVIGMVCMCAVTSTSQIPAWKGWRLFLPVVLISALIWISSKLILAHFTGFLHVLPFERSPLILLQHLLLVVRMLWTIHFYKVSWILSLFYWLAFSGLAWRAFQVKALPGRRLILLILLPTLVALPLALNTYPAPRAYYGPQILQSVMMAYLAFLVLTELKGRQILSYLPLMILTIIFSLEWGHVLYLKEMNYRTLTHEETELRKVMNECNAPCHLALPPPGKGLITDYILPEFVWSFYYERFRLLNFPKKKIEIQIVRTPSS